VPKFTNFCFAIVFLQPLTSSDLFLFSVFSIFKYTGRPTKVALGLNHYISATVQDKLKQISPKCSRVSENKDSDAVFTQLSNIRTKLARVFIRVKSYCANN